MSIQLTFIAIAIIIKGRAFLVIAEQLVNCGLYGILTNLFKVEHSLFAYMHTYASMYHYSLYVIPWTQMEVSICLIPIGGQ